MRLWAILHSKCSSLHYFKFRCASAHQHSYDLLKSTSLSGFCWKPLQKFRSKFNAICSTFQLFSRTCSMCSNSAATSIVLCILHPSGWHQKKRSLLQELKRGILSGCITSASYSSAGAAGALRFTGDIIASAPMLLWHSSRGVASTPPKSAAAVPWLLEDKPMLLPALQSCSSAALAENACCGLNTAALSPIPDCTGPDNGMLLW